MLPSLGCKLPSLGSKLPPLGNKVPVLWSWCYNPLVMALLSEGNEDMLNSMYHCLKMTFRRCLMIDRMSRFIYLHRKHHCLAD